MVEEGKWLLAVTSFETMNSVFKITDKNNSFPTATPGYWSSRGGAETMNKLLKFSKLRSENDIELHVEEVRKRGNQKKQETRNIHYMTLIIIKKEIIEIKKVE